MVPKDEKEQKEWLLAEAGIALSVYVNSAGILLDKSPQKLSQFLKSTQEKPSASFIDYLPETEHEAFMELLNSALQEQHIQHYPICFKRPINHIRLVLIRPFSDHVEMTIASPQHTHAPSESDLRRNRLINLGTLSSGIAHDLNNYFTGMSNCLTILRRQTLNSNAKETIDLLETSLDHSVQLGQKVLEYTNGESRLDEGFNLNTTIETMSLLFKTSLPEEIILSLDIPKTLPLINLSSVDMDQILLNLLTNAREAIDQSGKIDLSVWEESLEGKDYCVLRVRDDGIGMERPEFNKIFLSFYSTKGVSNSGLGLDIIKKIVNAASGRIELESDLGQGTTFKIFLPIRP